MILRFLLFFLLSFTTLAHAFGDGVLKDFDVLVIVQTVAKFGLQLEACINLSVLDIGFECTACLLAESSSVVFFPEYQCGKLDHDDP